MASQVFLPNERVRASFVILCGLLLVSAFLWTSAEAYKTFRESRRVGLSELSAPSISVYASGSATIANDIATVDLGVTKDGASASEVQQMSGDAMNTLIAALKDIGISSDDLQTSSYTVYPRYDYETYPAVIVGYEASQTVTVKIRNEDLVRVVFGKAAELGVTNIGGLRFEADDDSEALQAARSEAIRKARTQAEMTAQSLGVALGELVSYSESQGGMQYPLYSRSSVEMSDAMGGGVSPDVQLGQSDIELTVYITFSLR